MNEIYSKWVTESDTEKNNTEAETGRIRVGGGEREDPLCGQKGHESMRRASHEGSSDK